MKRFHSLKCKFIHGIFTNSENVFNSLHIGHNHLVIGSILLLFFKISSDFPFIFLIFFQKYECNKMVHI